MLPTLARLALIGVLALAPGVAARADEPGAETPRPFTRVPAPDGIQIRRFNKTDGVQPGKKDRVVVNYRGRLADGRVFDQSRPGSPAAFRLDAVIPCWKEALPRLHVGERAEIVCPGDTGYGPKGSPPKIPGNAQLTFEIELVGVE